MAKKAKILMLVEGAKTDVKLMQHLVKVYGISESHQIVSYNTNIYELYNRMFKDGQQDSCDLLQILKEKEKDEDKKKIFDDRYSDILLIFDLDPQDPQFSPEHILEMLRYFSESTDQGKLYLNYPMVEAFYHMKAIPDEMYNSYTATMQELKNGSYKARVRNENRNKDYRKFAIDFNECNIVIWQNIKKGLWMTGVAEDTQNILPESESILNVQLGKIKCDDSVSVLCTCVYYIVEYNPHLLIDGT